MALLALTLSLLSTVLSAFFDAYPYVFEMSFYDISDASMCPTAAKYAYSKKSTGIA